MNYKKYILGVIDSPEDYRDLTPEKMNIAFTETPITEIISKYRSNVYNQGNFGQCVAFSTAGIIEAANLKERGIRTRYSTSFIYGNRNDKDYQLEGMMPREGLSRIARYGTCEYDKFPLLGDYPTCKAEFIKRKDELIPIAMPQKIYAYCRLSSTQFEKFIQKYEIPVLATISVYESFYNTGIDGIVPPKSGNFCGGHAMQLVGSKIINGKKYAVCQNSWSDAWGNKGLCYIDYISMPFTEIWGMIDANPKQDISLPQKFMYVIGETYYAIDDKLFNFDVAPLLINARTYVPLRHWEHLGYSIKYTNSNQPNGIGSTIELIRGGEQNYNEF